jgi:glutamate 5-kinase
MALHAGAKQRRFIKKVIKIEHMKNAQGLKNAKRIVIKVGSALLTNDGKGLDQQAIAGWVAHIAVLQKAGIEVVLVSSGAVAEGMTRLGWQSRPESLSELQAAAAVGQVSLLHFYQQQFNSHDIQAAQILLVHDDLLDRRRYLNARNTLNTLIGLSVIPIVNENDTVATEEIRFGDNDTLGAMVANIIDADTLVILTDQDAMYEADPRKNPDARKITAMAAGSKQLESMAGGGGVLGRGGMTTKVRAAELAARSGTDTIIVGGRIDNVLERLAQGEALGTLLYADKAPLEARKLWLAGLVAKAQITLDAGAVKAVKKGGISVLPVGVSTVNNIFNKGDVVECLDENGTAVAKGLIDYSSSDLQKIKGVVSDQFESILGYKGQDELIHCDNLILL